MRTAIPTTAASRNTTLRWRAAAEGLLLIVAQMEGTAIAGDRRPLPNTSLTNGTETAERGHHPDPNSPAQGSDLIGEPIGGMIKARRGPRARNGLFQQLRRLIGSSRSAAQWAGFPDDGRAASCWRPCKHIRASLLISCHRRPRVHPRLWSVTGKVLGNVY